MLAFILKCILTFIIDAIEMSFYFGGSLFSVLFIIFSISRASELIQKKPEPIRLEEEEEEEEEEDPQPLVL